VDKPPNHHRQNSNSPLRSSLTVALSPVLSPPHDNHRLSMTSPDGDNFVDLPEQMRDDVTRHVILVELDKGVSGLGFCIKGGKQSPSGDQPVIVKRIFRCMYLDDELIPIYFTFMTCSLIRRFALLFIRLLLSLHIWRSLCHIPLFQLY